MTQSPPVCVFDLDHTLVSSPLDLKAVGREMEAFVRERGLPLPLRDLRWSGTEVLAFVRARAAELEVEIMAIPQAHERRAMEQAVLEPFAIEALTAMKHDPDGLRVVRERWPEAPHIVMVGDAWVDGLAAQAGGIPFIAYRADAAELERRGVSVTARINSLLELPAALA